MAVALLGTPASTSRAGWDSGTPDTSLTYTVSAGSNRVLVLFACLGDSLLPALTAASYGGQAMSAITGYLKNDANFVTAQAFYLLEAGIAAAGSTTVSITGVPGVAIDASIWGVAAFSDVHQTTPFGTAVTASGTGTAPATGSITVPANGLAIGSMCSDDDNAFSNASTIIFEVEGVNSDVGGGAQYRATTGDLVWTTDSQGWAAAGVPVSPTGAAGRTTKNTRTSPLGEEAGMGLRMNMAYSSRSRIYVPTRMTA
jgi:hypothetical protein